MKIKTTITCALMFTMAAFAFGDITDNYDVLLQDKQLEIKSKNQTVSYSLTVFPDFNKAEKFPMRKDDYFYIPDLSLKSEVAVNKKDSPKQTPHPIKRISLKELVNKKAVTFSDKVGEITYDVILTAEEGEDKDCNNTITVKLKVVEYANSKFEKQEI